jgi:hypothetical protein
VVSAARNVEMGSGAIAGVLDKNVKIQGVLVVSCSIKRLFGTVKFKVQTRLTIQLMSQLLQLNAHDGFFNLKLDVSLN